MYVDKESFTDLCIQLKLASDGMLKAARSLTLISGAGNEHEQHAWHQAIDGLSGTMSCITHMEKLLSALLEAQDLPAPTPSAGQA